MLVMAAVERDCAESSAVVPSHANGEVDVVRRAQLGSTAAFEQLVLSHGPVLHRFLAFRLRNESDARDALQETLAAAWQALPRLEHPGKLRPWLLGIAAHKAADAARRRPPVADAELTGHGREDSAGFELRDAILALPPRFRDVLLLRYVVQLSEEEAAEVLRVRVGTVKSRTARARSALAELLR